jgi:hypothetical protein
MNNVKSLRARAILISIILLIPCFWQRRIQAVDLGSHIYNSWLAQQIELGRAPGLRIVALSTNVLFDLILKALYDNFGADAAQRIAVGGSVLIFFWGAFALVTAVHGARPWFLAVCLAMLTYGWVFHMGFNNYYLAAGLSLWAVALSMRPGAAPRLATVALLAVAYTAHAIPVAWAVSVIAYIWVAGRLCWRRRQVLLVAGALGIAAFQYWITHRYPTKSTFHQVLECSGVDQVWVFQFKYMVISIGLGMLWGFMLLRISHLKGIRGMLGNPYFHICLLTGFGVLMIPTSVELPQYNLALSYITERITLLHGVMICAFLAGSEPPRWMRRGFIPLAALYFSFLYADTRALNKVERQMEVLTGSLTLGDRVFTSFEDPISRVQLWGHNLDRACLGRCLSYANYEPASLQFRIRADGPNRLVVSDIFDSGAMQDGGYRVKPGDLPLYQVTVCGAELCLRKLEAGEVTRHDPLMVLPLLW